MPELPEVETVRLQLLHKIKGETIKSVAVFNIKSVNHDTTFANRLTGKTFGQIERIGKLLIFHFAGKSDLFLLTHLRMTGQFFYKDKVGVSGGGHSLTTADTKELPGKHTRVAFYLEDGSALFFNDMRLFGYTKIATAEEVAIAKARFGQEPIHQDFDVSAFIIRLQKRKTPIKAALLDQTFIAGLGNIYVDEALFQAKVHPTRHANLVTASEAAAIAKASGEIMNKSISVGGTTFQHFVDTGGASGNYTDYLQVFGKQKTPCPRCGTIIEKMRVAGRGTHYCPTCQK
jgi:formamidopyrimidine-DNA glycosylase